MAGKLIKGCSVSVFKGVKTASLYASAVIQPIYILVFMTNKKDEMIKQIRSVGFFLIAVFLINSIVFSQPKEIRELSKKHLYNNTRHQLFETIENESSLELLLYRRIDNENFKLNVLGVVDSATVTILTDLKQKHEYTYDSNGNMTMDLRKQNGGSGWVNFSRYTYTYNSKGNITLKLYEVWEQDSANWVNGNRNTFTYDSNGNMTSDLGEIPSSSDTSWINIKQYIYVYDSNNNITLMSYKSYSQNVLRHIYTYDSNGNMTFKFGDSWDRDSSRWVANSKTTYTYDSNGNMTFKLGDKWYPNRASWVNVDRNTYTYDSNGNMTSDFREWFYDYTTWIISGKNTYAYDSNDNMTSNLCRSSNSDGTNWVDLYRHTFTFNTNGNLISHLYEFTYTGNLTNQDRYTYTYNSNGKLTSYLSEIWLGTEWANNLTYFSFVGEKGNIYSFYGAKVEIFYNTTTKVEEDENILDYALSQNYPNPFNPSTIISYSIPKSELVELKVYDLLGREVANLVEEEQTAGNYKIEFDASKLSSGIYFYRLQSGGFTNTKKLILLR
jgi:hypothetical protein